MSSLSELDEIMISLFSDDQNGDGILVHVEPPHLENILNLCFIDLKEKTVYLHCQLRKSLTNLQKLLFQRFSDQLPIQADNLVKAIELSLQVGLFLRYTYRPMMLQCNAYMQKHANTSYSHHNNVFQTLCMRIMKANHWYREMTNHRELAAARLINIKYIS